jgi:hypothetical protein
MKVSRGGGSSWSSSKCIVAPDELPLSVPRGPHGTGNLCTAEFKNFGVVSVMLPFSAHIRTQRRVFGFDDEAFVHSRRYLLFLLWPWQLTYFDAVELRPGERVAFEEASVIEKKNAA